MLCVSGPLPWPRQSSPSRTHRVPVSDSPTPAGRIQVQAVPCPPVGTGVVPGGGHHHAMSGETPPWLLGFEDSALVPTGRQLFGSALALALVPLI